MTRNRTACVAIVLLLMSGNALAQSRTFYGPDGKVSGGSITDSGGATTFYGANGKVSGRATTDSQGTTTIYGADGRKVGSYTGPKPQKGK